jgi:hypothetical protein
MQQNFDAWQLVVRGQQIDAMQFLHALRSLWSNPPADERSRLLLRDGLGALSKHWGTRVLQRRMAHIGFPPAALQPALEHAPGERGFHTLGDRMVDAIDPDVLERLFRDLGTLIREPTTVYVGGSMTLIWDALVVRATDDIDFVDEVPASIRSRPQVLDEIYDRYKVKLGHFQSHYLPAGWRDRVRSIGVFGSLTVMQVDPLDVLVGKMFSVRPKDLNDVQAAWKLIDQQEFRRRLAQHAAAFADAQRLYDAAKRGWYVLTGEEDLPHA